MWREKEKKNFALTTKMIEMGKKEQLVSLSKHASLYYKEIFPKQMETMKKYNNSCQARG